MVVSYFLFIKILFVSFNIYRCVACMCVVCSVHGAQQVALDLLELELQVVAETPSDEYWKSNPSTLRAVSTFNESHFTLQNPNMNQLSVACPRWDEKKVWHWGTWMNLRNVPKVRCSQETPRVVWLHVQHRGIQRQKADKKIQGGSYVRMGSGS